MEERGGAKRLPWWEAEADVCGDMALALKDAIYIYCLFILFCLLMCLLTSGADKGMQRANFQQIFLVQFFLHCVHNSIVLVEQDLIF